MNDNNNIHYVPPTGGDQFFNRVVRWLADHGVNLAGAETLTLVGRVSGTPQSIPVNPLRLDGTEYLVGVRGETQWVRNARAAGQAELGRGRRHRTVTLREVEPAQRVPVLQAYLDKWGWEVKRYLPEGLTADAGDVEIAAHAHQLPVFAIAD